MALPDQTRGGGKAAAEQASRVAAEDALRATTTRETGALDLLAFADATVAKGLLALMAHLDTEVRAGDTLARAESLSSLASP